MNPLMTQDEKVSASIKADARTILNLLKLEAEQKLEHEKAKSYAQRSEYFIHEQEIIIKFLIKELTKV
jgi:hypothetical protein